MSKKVPKPKRLMIRVQWRKGLNLWVIILTHTNGIREIHSDFPEKELAVMTGRHIGRKSRVWYGAPAQLLIYNKNGRIGKGRNAEASYGCDSKAPG